MANHDPQPKKLRPSGTPHFTHRVKEEINPQGESSFAPPYGIHQIRPGHVNIHSMSSAPTPIYPCTRPEQNRRIHKRPLRKHHLQQGLNIFRMDIPEANNNSRLYAPYKDNDEVRLQGKYASPYAHKYQSVDGSNNDSNDGYNKIKVEQSKAYSNTTSMPSTDTERSTKGPPQFQPKRIRVPLRIIVPFPKSNEYSPTSYNSKEPHIEVHKPRTQPGTYTRVDDSTSNTKVHKNGKEPASKCGQVFTRFCPPQKWQGSRGETNLNGGKHQGPYGTGNFKEPDRSWPHGDPRGRPIDQSVTGERYPMTKSEEPPLELRRVRNQYGTALHKDARTAFPLRPLNTREPRAWSDTYKSGKELELGSERAKLPMTPNVPRRQRQNRSQIVCECPPRSKSRSVDREARTREYRFTARRSRSQIAKSHNENRQVLDKEHLDRISRTSSGDSRAANWKKESDAKTKPGTTFPKCSQTPSGPCYNSQMTNTYLERLYTEFREKQTGNSSLMPRNVDQGTSRSSDQRSYQCQAVGPSHICRTINRDTSIRRFDLPLSNRLGRSVDVPLMCQVDRHSISTSTFQSSTTRHTGTTDSKSDLKYPNCPPTSKCNRRGKPEPETEPECKGIWVPKKKQLSADQLGEIKGPKRKGALGRKSKFPTSSDTDDSDQDNAPDMLGLLRNLTTHPYARKLFKSLLLFLLGLKICSESWYMLIPIRGMGITKVICPCSCS